MESNDDRNIPNSKGEEKDKLDKNVFEDLQLSETDIVWLAGLLEGEGTFLLDRRAATLYEESTSPPSPILRVSMTDGDVIARVAKMLNKKPFIATAKTKGNKIEHIVSCQARPPLFYLLPRLLPYMGERRTIEIQKCIDALEDWKIWYLRGGRRKSSSKAGKISAEQRALKKNLTRSNFYTICKTKT